MKINLDIDGKYDGTEVIIRAPHLNNDIERIVAMMRMIDMQIAVRKEGETYLLETDKILYIEAVDRKLYELEQDLIQRDFLRISKQSIVNLRKIKSLKADVNRKIRITLQNGEQIVVSRMYSDELRRKLGLR